MSVLLSILRSKAGEPGHSISRPAMQFQSHKGFLFKQAYYEVQENQEGEAERCRCPWQSKHRLKKVRYHRAPARLAQQQGLSWPGGLGFRVQEHGRWGMARLSPLTDPKLPRTKRLFSLGHVFSNITPTATRGMRHRGRVA